MKIKNGITVCLMALTILSSCATVSKKEVGLSGNYYGQLPCADCAGIDYSLSIHPEGTYQSKNVYHKNGDTIQFVEKGKVEIENDSLFQLLPNKGERGRWIKREGEKLVLLDGDKNEIKGALASYYILSKNKTQKNVLFPKTDYRLYDIWALKSMNGKKLNADSLMKGLPTMEINLKKQRVAGSASCNRYGGKIEAKKDSIHFSAVFSTKMYCKNIKVEDEFLNAISNKTLHFTIKENHLILESKTYNLVFQKVD